MYNDLKIVVVIVPKLTYTLIMQILTSHYNNGTQRVEPTEFEHK